MFGIGVWKLIDKEYRLFLGVYWLVTGYLKMNFFFFQVQSVVRQLFGIIQAHKAITNVNDNDKS